ncbi:MAG TPA: stability/partitioning determinant [Xanthobacteraceae bacterium]
MTGKRLSIFGNTDDLDLSTFTPQPKSRKPKPPPEKVRAVSEAAKFPSREASAPDAEPATQPAGSETVMRKPRYHKTGRTAQLNCRVMPATYERIYAIADQQGWLVGQTVEQAVAALVRELENGAEQGTCTS